MKRLDALMLYAYQKKQEQEREQEETKELSVTEKRQMGRDKKKKILSLTEEVKDLAFRMRELFLMQDICEQLGIELPERSGLPDNWDILTLDDHRRYLIIRRDGCSLDNLLQSYLRILLIEQAGTVRVDIYFNPAMSFMGELKIPDQLEMLEYGMEEMDDLIQYMEKNFLPRFEDIERRVFEAVDKAIGYREDVPEIKPTRAMLEQADPQMEELAGMFHEVFRQAEDLGYKFPHLIIKGTTDVDCVVFETEAEKINRLDKGECFSDPLALIDYVNNWMAKEFYEKQWSGDREELEQDEIER